MIIKMLTFTVEFHVEFNPLITVPEDCLKMLNQTVK